MKALIQRVSEAQVCVNGVSIGETGPGLLILVCAMPGDTLNGIKALASKVSKLRIFKDENDKMNLSLIQTGGSALVVSQFTLAADTSSGNRPGFSAAAKPEEAKLHYLHFAHCLRELSITTQTGQFGADMKVSLINDGPITIWMDTEA